MALGGKQGDAGGVPRGDQAAVGRAELTPAISQEPGQQFGLVGQGRPVAVAEARPVDADQPEPPSSLKAMPISRPACRQSQRLQRWGAALATAGDTAGSER